VSGILVEGSVIFQVKMAKQFAVIHFTNPTDNSIDIVPIKWLSAQKDTNTEVLWPKLLTPAFSRFKLNPDHTPGKDWISHPCKVLGRYRKLRKCMAFRTIMN